MSTNKTETVKLPSKIADFDSVQKSLQTLEKKVNELSESLNKTAESEDKESEDESDGSNVVPYVPVDKSKLH